MFLDFEKKNRKNVRSFRQRLLNHSGLQYTITEKSVPVSQQRQTSLLRNADVVFTFTRNYATKNRTPHPFNGPLSGTTQVSQYQKGKNNLDFTEARDSEWQWHQLGHIQVCTTLQTNNHASTPPLRFLQARCPSCRPTNSVKALKGQLRTELCVINVCKCSNTLGWLINNNWNELEITERSIWTHFKGLMTKLLLTTFFTTFWRHFEKNVKSNVFWNLWIFWKNVKYVFSNTVVVLLRCVASRPATGRWLPLAFILFFQVVPFLASRSPNSNFPANCCK